MLMKRGVQLRSSTERGPSSMTLPARGNTSENQYRPHHDHRLITEFRKRSVYDHTGLANGLTFHPLHEKPALTLSIGILGARVLNRKASRRLHRQ